MSKLEELTIGSSVKGLLSNEVAQIVAVKWYGTSVLDITYKNSQGMLANQLLYREDEARLEVVDKKLLWNFDADGDIVRLASEAYRINLSGNDTDKEECETTRILPFLLTINHDHIPLEKSISSDMGSIEEIG